MKRRRLISAAVALCFLTVTGLTAAASFTGTGGSDFIVGTDQADNLKALAGGDSVYGVRRRSNRRRRRE